MNEKICPCKCGRSLYLCPPGSALLTVFSVIDWQGRCERQGAGELMSQGLVRLSLWSRTKRTSCGTDAISEPLSVEKKGTPS